MSLSACTQTAQVRRVSQDTGHLLDQYKKGRYSHFNDKTAGDRIDGTNPFKKVSGKVIMWIKQIFRKQTWQWRDMARKGTKELWNISFILTHSKYKIGSSPFQSKQSLYQQWMGNIQ